PIEIDEGLHHVCVLGKHIDRKPINSRFDEPMLVLERFWIGFQDEAFLVFQSGDQSQPVWRGRQKIERWPVELMAPDKPNGVSVDCLPEIAVAPKLNVCQIA